MSRVILVHIKSYGVQEARISHRHTLYHLKHHLEFRKTFSNSFFSDLQPKKTLLQMEFWLFLVGLNTTVSHLLYVWVARPSRIASQQLAVQGWGLLGRLLNLFLSFPKVFKSKVNAPDFPGTQRPCLSLAWGSTCKPRKTKAKRKSQRV